MDLRPSRLDFIDGPNFTLRHRSARADFIRSVSLDNLKDCFYDAYVGEKISAVLSICEELVSCFFFVSNHYFYTMSFLDLIFF